jgi:hypothetical protein
MNLRSRYIKTRDQMLEDLHKDKYVLLVFDYTAFYVSDHNISLP